MDYKINNVCNVCYEEIDAEYRIDYYNKTMAMVLVDDIPCITYWFEDDEVEIGDGCRIPTNDFIAIAEHIKNTKKSA